MVLLHPCIPCQHGDHDACMGGRAAPEGMLGGWQCPCEGECADRLAPASVAVQRVKADLERGGDRPRSPSAASHALVRHVAPREIPPPPETWPIIEHEPEDIPDVPPDLRRKRAP